MSCPISTVIQWQKQPTAWVHVPFTPPGHPIQFGDRKTARGSEMIYASLVPKSVLGAARVSKT
eukprot:scaffold134660_cov20-Prasinocladus_malaysianus.AAC.1